MCSSDTYQIFIKVEKHGNYMVPRYCTNLILPILNHENLRWSVIDRNRRKTPGLTAYIEYLGDALDEVNFKSNYFTLLKSYINYIITQQVFYRKIERYIIRQFII